MFRGRRAALVAGAAISALALLSACSSGGGNVTPTDGGSTDGGGGLQPVAICTGPQPDYAPFYVAKEMGMWEKYGMDLTISICPTSPIAIAAILNNEVAMSNNSVTGVSTAIGQGIPAKVVLPITLQPQEGNTYVFVPVDSDIQTFADLAGKTLGTITVQGLFHLGLADAMTIQGADPTTMKVVGSAPTDLGALLDSGKVDAIMIQDATATQIKQQLGDKIRDIGNPFAIVPWGKKLVIGAMTASDRQLNDNPELYRKFREGWAEAIQLTEDNPDIMYKVIAEYSGLDPALLKAITWGKWTTELDEANTMEMLNTMLKYGFVKAIPEFSQIYWEDNGS